MWINIVSEWLPTRDFKRAFEDLCRDQFPEVEGLNHVSPDDVDVEKVIVLGTPPEDYWQPMPNVQVYKAPSMAQVVNTAGGLTKLSYAINLYLNDIVYSDDFFASYTRVGEAEVGGMVVGGPRVDMAVVDIETSGDIDKDLPEETDLLAVSLLVPDVNGEPVITVFDKSALDSEWGQLVLGDWLSRTDKLVAHNGKFDFRWLNRLLKLNLYPADDTMLMHHSMFHGAGEHGLKPLAQRILGAPEWEAEKDKYLGKGGKSHYERIPQDVLCKYNAQDVFWTYQLWLRFTAMLEVNEAASRAYALEMEAAHMFQDIEAFGMPVDMGYADYLDEYFMSRYEVALKELMDIVYTRVTEAYTPDDSWEDHEKEWAAAELKKFTVKFPNSPTQVKKFLLLNGVHAKNTDEKTLAALRMSNRLPEFCDALLKCRQLKKAHSTYVKGVVTKVLSDGRVHPVFKIHGTTTGRLSCSRPNVQNVPNDDDNEDGMPSLRRVYAGSDGWVFVGADYSQAELRVIAELAGDEQMLYDLRDGAPDFFDNMLPSIWPQVDFSTLNKTQRKPYRLKLKRIVYGLNYGRTPWAIAMALTLEGSPTSVGEATVIAKNYLGRYKGLEAWRANTMRKVYDDDWTTPFGRTYQQDVITEDRFNRTQNMAWAFMPQSIASDICLTAAIAVHKRMKALGMEAHLCATVHDAIYALAPEHEAELVESIIKEEMTASAARYYTGVVFPVDAHHAKEWNLC